MGNKDGKAATPEEVAAFFSTPMYDLFTNL
jgi:hypothetical protein